MAAPARVIPGLVPSATAPSAKGRSRKKSGKTVEAVAAVVETPAVIEKVEPAPVEVEVTESEEKRSAVAAVQKRLRACTKKIQRIVTYEQKTEALNEDQKKAISSKPALEAVLKELQELLQILKEEEAEDDNRLAKLRIAEATHAAANIQAAVAAANAASQASVVYLLDFFNLHGLYAPSTSGTTSDTTSGFAPVVLPSVVANATASEVAAVMYIRDALANGPNGQAGALEILAKLQSSDESEVILDVTFARINELVQGLTASPAPEEVIEDEEPFSASLPAGPKDSTTSLVAGSIPDATPSFLQASELTSDAVPTTVVPGATPVEPFTEKVTSWADDVEESQLVAPSEPAPAPPMTWGALTSAPTLDWANEDEDDQGLPSLDSFSPMTPAVVKPSNRRPAKAPRGPRPQPGQESAPAPVIPVENMESDGFQSVKTSRANNNNNRGRGQSASRGGGGERRAGNDGARGGRTNGNGGEKREGAAPRREGENGGPRRGGDNRGKGGNRPKTGASNGATETASTVVPSTES